jgi:hypothetical protein
MQVSLMLLGSNVIADQMPAEKRAVRRLTPEEASKRVSAGGRGLLQLDEIDAATASALADFQGEIELNVTTLDADIAKALAEYKGYLCFYGLKRLDTEASKALANFKGKRLAFEYGCHLDMEAARAIAQFDGDGEIVLRSRTTTTEAKRLLQLNPRIRGVEFDSKERFSQLADALAIILSVWFFFRFAGAIRAHTSGASNEPQDFIWYLERKIGCLSLLVVGAVVGIALWLVELFRTM